MAEPNSYEEQRRRQVEENKRKLEELRLHRLSAAVREAAVKPMPIQELKLRYLRPPPPPTRRSGRVASLPKQPDYRDKKAPRAYVNRRGLPPDRVYATDEARDYAFTKAKELNNQLSSAHPSFIKPMTHSYATGSLLANSLGHLEQIDSYALGHQVRFGSLNYVTDIRGDLIFDGFETTAAAPHCLDEHGLNLSSGSTQEIAPVAAPALNPEQIKLPDDGKLDSITGATDSAALELHADSSTKPRTHL
ncbi:hypothetical protein TRIUR3_21664 [Triticum urartu]|uniref:Uncharacterized protein n=1 Tax=Triticum urartu TaxID=4572 RepID=M8A2Q2_TRIUA|nr:hypothetical protein TRIUR3_21664 [Triticum urartu]